MAKKQQHDVSSYEPPRKRGPGEPRNTHARDEVDRTATALNAERADESTESPGGDDSFTMEAISDGNGSAVYTDSVVDEASTDDEAAGRGAGFTAGARPARAPGVTFEIPLRLTLDIGAARQANGAVAPAKIPSRIDFGAARSAPRAAPSGPEMFESGATIPATQLRQGDVLLYHGTSLIARGISFLDGTEVSHAALYVGNSRVDEAIGKGLISRSLRESKGSEHPWILARRLNAVPTPTMTPVMGTASAYLAKHIPYAYQQIVMLALLALVRKTTPSGLFGLLLRSLLDTAATMLNNFMRGGKELMICSEFVYRCYDEAVPGPGDRYSIVVADLHFELGQTEAAVAALPAGQGVHPESALAAVIRNPGAFAGIEAIRDGVEATEAADDAAVEIKIRQVERYLDRYMNEVRDGRPHPVAEAAADPASVSAALVRFAIALEKARPLDKPRRRTVESMEAFPAHVPASVKRLFQTAADFVTPGDLYKTQSLKSLGQITGI